MNISNKTIVIIDDKEAKMIKKAAQASFKGWQIEFKTFSTTEDAKRFLLIHFDEVEAIIFDSAFGFQHDAGCQLYLELLKKYGREKMESKCVFLTAYEWEVYPKLLGDPKHKTDKMLNEDQIIRKGVNGYSKLTKKLHEMISQVPYHG